METKADIEKVIGERISSRPEATIRRVGDAALELERFSGEVVLSWISQLSLRDFIRKFKPTTGMVRGISVSRPSPDHSFVNPNRLIHPKPLSDEEAASIFLIRYDEGSYSLGFEPLEVERTSGFNVVSVMAPTKEDAIEHLEKFLPIEAVSVASGLSFSDQINKK